MNVPKKIYELAEKRAKAAERFNHYDYELSTWLDEHGVNAESYDTHGGSESLVNPYASAYRIKQLLDELKG